VRVAVADGDPGVGFTAVTLATRSGRVAASISAIIAVSALARTWTRRAPQRRDRDRVVGRPVTLGGVRRV
jgi:hypothetical protein